MRGSEASTSIADIAANLAGVRDRIGAAAHAAGRESASLVAVSKGQPQTRIDAALAAGQRVFGENRVREVANPFDFIVQCVASAPEAAKGDSIAWDELSSCPGHRVSLAVYDRPCSDS